LRYSSASDAADCLISAFSSWQHPAPLVQPLEQAMHSGRASGRTATLESDLLISRATYVFEYEADGNSFLASPASASIFRLNLLASAIWKLLETPIRPTEVVEIVQVAFPDEDRDTVRHDILGLMKLLVDGNFIEFHDAGELSQEV
jgi:hypothetical protein